MEQIVYLRNATIDRGNQSVLKRINLSMSKSEFVYLVGRTGSGKSSLLKTLWGELPLLEGAGKIANYDLATLSRKDVSALRRKIGMIFQEFNLFEDWSLHDNLLFVLDATGWKGHAQMEARIAQVLHDVQLDMHMDKRANQLSGGEQQRLVIARAILNTPEIILADEPTGNLDPQTSVEILHLLRDLAVRYNTAILMATHDQSILTKFPGRVYECDEGRLQEID
jgi:cell division transport system ATP-binding protein